MTGEKGPSGSSPIVPIRRPLDAGEAEELAQSMNRHPAGKRRALSPDEDGHTVLRWDRVHNKPATIYTPPEDVVLTKRPVAQRYRITTPYSVTEQTLDEIEAEGGFPYLLTVARNLGLGPLTIEAL
jgi:hypothetical protein